MIEAQVAFAVRVLVVAVFATAAAGKLRRRERFTSFAASLGALLPGTAPVRTAVAVAVTVAEVAVAVLTAVSATAPLGLAAAAALLLAFAAGIALASARNARIPCHCFGSAGADLGPRHVVRNLLLAAVAAVAAALGLLPGAAPAPGPAAFAAAVVLGLAAAVMFVHADALLTAVHPSAPARRRSART